MHKKLSELVSLSLERTYRGDKGFEFEKFAQDLSRCQHGENFFATSPFKDGGIDGFTKRTDEDDELIITRIGKPSIIFQYGTTENLFDKIENTYNDLNKIGIVPRKIYYYTPRSVSNLALRVSKIEDKLDVAVEVRDHAYICNLAANNECKHIFTDFYVSILGAIESKDDDNLKVDYPSLYLSAWYRYENKEQHNDTLSSMTDSLIMWALRDTDPDKNQFLNANEIYKAIENSFSSSKTTIKSMFNDRLHLLTKQTNKHGRKIVQKHKELYCLPYESRLKMKELNEESVEILFLAKQSFYNRIEANYSEEHKQKIVNLALHTIKNIYTNQGMRLVESINSTEEDFYHDIQLIDAVDKACNDFTEISFSQNDKRCVTKLLRKVFASPSENEQRYLIKTSYLYIMHYIMHNNMDIVSYFKEKTQRLKLVVHSDILVLAISEQYLPEEGQHYRNMLKYLSNMGAELLVTEEAIIEIYKNLQIATLSYRENIQGFESSFNLESIKYLPILITRAYMYNKISGAVNSWEQFINNFCSPAELLSKPASAKEDLRIYLTGEFKLKILRSDEIKESVKSSLVDSLSSILIPKKKIEAIARHVASVNIYVSTMRHKNQEISTNPFGYKTYWLTREKTVYKIAKDFFDANDLGTYLIMRPEFIMNQIMLTPDEKNISDSYTSTFPTALGIQMSEQLDKKTFNALMRKMYEIKELNESRAKAILNKTIQIAAENTEVSKDMSFYEREDVSDYNPTPEENNGQLKQKIEEIIKKAERR